jgi:hypothetical protein
MLYVYANIHTVQLRTLSSIEVFIHIYKTVNSSLKTAQIIWMQLRQYSDEQDYVFLLQDSRFLLLVAAVYALC